VHANPSNCCSLHQIEFLWQNCYRFIPVTSHCTCFMAPNSGMEKEPPTSEHSVGGPKRSGRFRTDVEKAATTTCTSCQRVCDDLVPCQCYVASGGATGTFLCAECDDEDEMMMFCDACEVRLCSRSCDYRTCCECNDVTYCKTCIATSSLLTSCRNCSAMYCSDCHDIHVGAPPMICETCEKNGCKLQELHKLCSALLWSTSNIQQGCPDPLDSRSRKSQDDPVGDFPK
jgi:hypothetical protein